MMKRIMSKAFLTGILLWFCLGVFSISVLGETFGNYYTPEKYAEDPEAFFMVGSGQFVNLKGNTISWEVWKESDLDFYGTSTLYVYGQGDLGPDYKGEWACSAGIYEGRSYSPMSPGNLKAAGVSGANLLKHLVFAEGITDIPDYVIGSLDPAYRGFSTIVFPNSVKSIHMSIFDHFDSHATYICDSKSYAAARIAEAEKSNLNLQSSHDVVYTDQINTPTAPVQDSTPETTVPTDATSSEPDTTVPSTGEPTAENPVQNQPDASAAAPTVTQKPTTQVSKKTVIKVKTAAKTVKRSKVKKAAQKFSIGASANSKAKLTFKKISGSKCLSIAKTTGKVSVKKGTKKGIYTMKVKITAPKKGVYNKAVKTVTIKVKIK